MKSFIEPGGQTTSMLYDDAGRLRREEGPGGLKILEGTDIPFGSRVTLRSGMGRAEVYEIVEQPTANGAPPDQQDRRRDDRHGAEGRHAALDLRGRHERHADGRAGPALGPARAGDQQARRRHARRAHEDDVEKRTATFTTDDPVTAWPR